MPETDQPSPPLRRLGYARVSTYGQTLGAQLDQLAAAGCGQVYRETASGARADRRELARLLKAIGAGDELVVTRIDRLARSTFDLFAIVKQVSDAGARFRSLSEPWADTGTATGRLMIAVLGGLADVERDLIRTRTAEGRARAKARGAHLGRPRKMTAEQQREARARLADGEPLADLARSYGVSASTISRMRKPGPSEGLPERVAALRARVLARPATGLEADKAFYDALSGHEDGGES